MVVLILGLATASVSGAANAYKVDPVHSSFSFTIPQHGISNIHGRFNDYSGKFEIDKADPAKSSFTFSIKVESIDTGNAKRDEHLRAPDYFNVKQFPTMTFESKTVKAVEGGYEVSGDLTMMGVTKPVTFKMLGGNKEVVFPKGVTRIGFNGEAVIKRSDFGLKVALNTLGDEVHIIFGLQATK
jgi:polyisoprenoid-binding protein YceI